MAWRRLSSGERDEYAKNGFVCIEGFLSCDRVRVLREAIAALLWRSEHRVLERCHVERDGRESIQIKHLWQASRVVRQFLLSSGIAPMAAELMGDTTEVRLWHDQALWKPAGRGGPVNFHQDYYYWQPVTPPDLTTAWLALHDCGVEGGCLSIVPGSHHWGLLDNRLDAGVNPPPNDDVEHLLKQAAREHPTLSSVPISVRQGDVVFLHCLALHGSYENRGTMDRLAYIQHLMPRHAQHQSFSWGSNALRIEVPVGERIRGGAFPLLWRASHSGSTDDDYSFKFKYDMEKWPP